MKARHLEALVHNLTKKLVLSVIQASTRVSQARWSAIVVRRAPIRAAAEVHHVKGNANKANVPIGMSIIRITEKLRINLVCHAQLERPAMRLPGLILTVLVVNLVTFRVVLEKLAA